MELLKEATSVVIIVALVLGLNWLLRKSGFKGS